MTKSQVSQQDTEFLIACALEAAEMINDDFFIAVKDANGDLVTSFDFEIERFIIDKIKEKYKNFDIISEEFNPTNKLTDNCFIIDPLDGTINFAHGLPLFGIQVAMVKKGKVVCSVIYLPKLFEIFYANQSGAYMTNVRPKALKRTYQEQIETIPQYEFWTKQIIKESKKISVSDTPCDRAIYLVEGGNKFPALTRMNDLTRHWRYICCTAVNSAWTACGRLGGSILRKDNIWDYLPGQYLIQQAGGYIINKKGAHIATNTKELGKLLLKNARLTDN
ncbi:MAG: inositol monophosphatase [Firmicutes bacterium]|nr:inositol monophosphatase [Bacillota bacterium]